MATRTQTASERITEEVSSWPGVEAGPGRRGEFAFTLGRRELGHLHGDHAFHAGFPKEVWQELFEAGRIDYPRFREARLRLPPDRDRRGRTGRDRDDPPQLRPCR